MKARAPAAPPSPPAEPPLVLSVALLEQARELFEDHGSHGCEATALIAAGPRAEAPRLVVPTQTATRADSGASVRVELAGQLELAAALRAEETYVARIHSHPVRAFHSYADDENPVLTHRGAISIVVPYFGLGLRHGLQACAVLRFDGHRWIDLPAGPDRDLTVVAASDEQENRR